MCAKQPRKKKEQMMVSVLKAWGVRFNRIILLDIKAVKFSNKQYYNNMIMKTYPNERSAFFCSKQRIINNGVWEAGTYENGALNTEC